jgi:hypothetical protein
MPAQSTKARRMTGKPALHEDSRVAPIGLVRVRPARPHWFFIVRFGLALAKLKLTT